jgi:hypothetical protein
VYLFSVGCSRALSTEPLLVRFSDSDRAAMNEAAGETVGTSLIVGLASGALCILLASFLGDPLGPTLRALGFVLPGLLLQDGWRYVFFAAGRPAKALANDAVWAVVQFGITALLLLRGQPGVPALVLAWGGSATVGAILGVFQSGVMPRPGRLFEWLHSQRDLAPRFLGEFSLGLGAAQLSIWLVGLVGGLSVLGAIRGALVLLGPPRIFLGAAPGAAIPELIRIHRRSRSAFQRAVWATSAALGGLVLLWGMAMFLLPPHVGRALLGTNWPAAHRLLLLITIQWSALGFGGGAVIGLRVLADARRSFRARLLITPFLIVVPPASVALGQATGAAAGLALVSSWSAVVWWLYYRGAQRAVDRRVLATPEPSQEDTWVPTRPEQALE